MTPAKPPSSSAGGAGPGAPAARLDLKVIARAQPADDVVAEKADGRVALVHMTWSGRRESPPWSTTEFLDSAADLHRSLKFRY